VKYKDQMRLYLKRCVGTRFRAIPNRYGTS
jgi:hypothetical protein